MNQLVLSLFPGAGLLDRGFTLAGFCVVRGPEALLGGDVREFHAAAAHFAGVIGGPPCQDFSRARRAAPTGYGLAMLAEFRRVVTEAAPLWWLMENVPTVPTLTVEGYTTQRLHLDARECGLSQRRRRCFQFGSLDGVPIRPQRMPVSQCPRTPATVLANDGRRRLSWLATLQGLPGVATFRGLSVATTRRLIGNGVPVPMARVIAEAIRDRYQPDNARRCACGCGRALGGNPRSVTATATCRKTMQRRRQGTEC